MKNKVVALLVTLFMLVGILGGCGGTATNQPAKPEGQAQSGTAQNREIRIAYQVASSITLLAKAKGFYEEEFGKDGTKVAYTLFISGPPLMEAFAGGRMDVGNVGDMPPVSARAAGIDLKAIARSNYNPSHNALLIPTNSPITSAQELKGKKVAVQVGSSAHHFLILLLNKNGLKASDIQLVNLPAPDQQAALETKNVDAVSTWEPYVTGIELANAGKVLANTNDVKRSVGVYVVRNEFGVQNPDLVERFLKANQRAVEYAKAHPDEAIALISQESKLSVPVVSKPFKASDFSLGVTAEDIKALEQVKDFLKETNVIKKDYDINDLFDLHYLKTVGI